MRTWIFDDRPGAADMAHGFQSRPLFGTTVLGHGGGLNEFLSKLVFIPELGAGVFISQNGGTGASLPFLSPDMAELAAEARLEAQAPEPVPDASARTTEAAWRHLSNRRAFSGPAQVLAALAQLTVTARPDGALLAPTPILQAVSRFDPIAPDLWKDAQGERLWLIRDERGRVVRLADGIGTQAHERAQGLTDPVWLGVGFGFAGCWG